MKTEEDFSAIYFLGSPKLYFSALEIAVLLNSLYMSVWVTNFITLAKQVDQNWYQIVM